LGEAWRSYFEADRLHDQLLKLGFSEVEDLGPAKIAARYFPNRAVNLLDKGGHILRATKI
jgi:hypothetical protein